MASSSASEDFKTAVKAFIAMHDQLAEAGKALREVRRKKKELSEVIVAYMRENDITTCDLKDGSGALVRKQSRRMEAIKKEHILEELKQVVGDARADDMLVSIFAKRAVAEKDTLTRTKRKASASAADE